MRSCRAAVFTLLTVALSACGDSDDPTPAPDPNNEAPTARLDLPAQATVGEVVLLDASRSSDPDGRIDTYLFSFDGPPFLQTRNPTLTHVFSPPGDVLISLTGMDDQGTKATARATITVSP